MEGAVQDWVGREHALAISFVVPVLESDAALGLALHAADELKRFLVARWPGDFEILIVPNGAPPGLTRFRGAALELLERRSGVRVVIGSGPGKGAALAHGVEAACGRWVFTTDVDLPYELEFFERAAKELCSGARLVAADRRLDGSTFELPVHLLPLAASRHRLGLAFNAVVRGLLGLQSTDTQAGAKAMDAEFARCAFVRIGSTRFVYDVELFTFAEANRLCVRSLPVRFRLQSEASSVRLAREAVLACGDLALVALRRSLGHYDAAAPLAHYARLGPLERHGLGLRWRLTPFEKIGSHVPPRGAVLDLACGHGLLSLHLADAAPDRRVLGVDHDAGRVECARHAGRALRNVEFHVGDAFEGPPMGPWDAIVIVDALHYLEESAQLPFLEACRKALAPGGVLVIREIDVGAGGLRPSLNVGWERLMTGFGLTRTQAGLGGLRTRCDWTRLLEQAGLQAWSEPCSNAAFADVLFVARAAEAARTELQNTST